MGMTTDALQLCTRRKVATRPGFMAWLGLPFPEPRCCYCTKKKLSEKSEGMCMCVLYIFFGDDRKISEMRMKVASSLCALRGEMIRGEDIAFFCHSSSVCMDKYMCALCSFVVFLFSSSFWQRERVHDLLTRSTDWSARGPATRVHWVSRSQWHECEGGAEHSTTKKSI